MSTNNELVARAQGGDEPAFEALYKQYHTGVQKYIHSRVKNEHTAQDLASETFLKAWRNIRTVACGPGNDSFRAWLFTIAHNVTMDYFRRLSCRPEVLVRECAAEGLLEPSPETLVIRRVGIETVLTTPLLNRQQKQCIVLSFFVGLTTREIAVVMGKPEGTIKSMRYYALRKLKEAVGL